MLTLPDGTKLGVVISWEVFFGGRANEGVEHGGTFILNPTNGSSYTWTVLQSQQVASSPAARHGAGALDGAGRTHRVQRVRLPRR